MAIGTSDVAGSIDGGMSLAARRRPQAKTQAARIDAGAASSNMTEAPASPDDAAAAIKQR
jgi:hypothetical protein